eukprot:TRINITY_DN81051_c0_g1_i1.p1 TRINITY_DN81051_c0_g1~~TRINITY_DN81051_c0_g1_i1.p1  ORF type:complete len:451 (-),score=122.22 TRINITY_DN81051_c0_g1_i1:108-1382(-)
MAPKAAPPVPVPPDDPAEHSPRGEAPLQQLSKEADHYRELATGSGENLKKTLRVFKEFDADGSGAISPGELQAALRNRTGMVLSAREFRKVLAGCDTDHNGEIDIIEFAKVIKKLFGVSPKQKAKQSATRNPRAYLTPDQYSHYAQLFKGAAGEGGLLDASELADFLAKYNMKVSDERLKAIMAEVDDDNSGLLDETEFLTLLIKATGVKKRKVGPGLAAVSDLQKEGWTLADLKKGGYECEDVLQAGYSTEEMMEIFTPAELGAAGVSLTTLQKHGWDCVKARESGFSITDMVESGCSVQLIREAGWVDVPSAGQLRQLGVSTALMKAGGWSMSELRMAGYSTCDLRLAGYSEQGIRSLQRLLGRKANLKPPKRRSTFDFQRAAALQVSSMQNISAPQTRQGTNSAPMSSMRQQNSPVSNDGY